jgi:hypothetical protein
LLPIRAAQRAQWLAEKNFTEADVPLGLSMLIDTAIELRLKASTYFEGLLDGPLTAKGRQSRRAEHHRRESESLARVIDRIQQHASARPANPMAAYLAQRSSRDAEADAAADDVGRSRVPINIDHADAADEQQEHEEEKR